MSQLATQLVISCAALVAVMFSSKVTRASVAPDEIAEDRDFKPLIEAPMPEGFPEPTPVGVVEFKRYPSYRKAEAAGRIAFWMLFQHIRSQGISMTAPVEMAYRTDDPTAGREMSMAFLYQDPGIGNTGRKGAVEVVDVPAMPVVSIGLRGTRSDAILARAETRLRDWLEANKDSYEASGPVRVMGYNSPFVPRDRQFYEVQIPIRKRSD